MWVVSKQVTWRRWGAYLVAVGSDSVAARCGSRWEKVRAVVVVVRRKEDVVAQLGI